MKKIKQTLRHYPDKYFEKLFVRSKQIQETLAKFEASLQDLVDKQNELIIRTKRIDDNTRNNNDLLSVLHDGIPHIKERLESFRKSNHYSSYFTKKQPLVSVRIATYNRAKLLTERAIPSVLNQTYQNFEVIVVGDHCDDETEKLIKKINDKRIKFYNLPQRTFYPEDKYKKWLVVGGAAANKAIEMAKGDWIATLDDDDEFRPNHLETLVKLAQKTKSELVYGALLSFNGKTKEQKVIWSDPPRHGDFSMMGAIYLRGLFDFIKTDEQGWARRLPQDWYLCKRMIESGVKYSTTNTITGDIYYTSYEEKKDL